MEIALQEAQARLAALVTAVQNGKRVVITKHAEPVAEIVGYRGRGGIEFDKLAEARILVGLAGKGREMASGVQRSGP